MRHNLNKESENSDRWLVSYADFITLLFAFFVVMYSVSQVNEGKFKILSETLTDAFAQPERSLQPIQIGEVNKADTTTSGDKTYPTDYMGEPATIETDMAFEALKEDLQTSYKGLIEDDLIKIRSNQDSVALEFKSDNMFESGEATVNPRFMPLILDIVAKYRGSDNALQIQGYTDNIPVNTRQFPSNWALSSARASSFAMILERNGIDPKRLTVEGYGEHQPRESNDTPEGRASNRRLVVVYTRFPPQRSDLDRKAQVDSAVLSQSATTTTTVDNRNTGFTLVRAPDGSLIVRGSANNNENDDNTTNTTNNQ